MIISNQEEALELFHKFDEPIRAYHPKNYDGKANSDKFQLFIKRLQKRTKKSFSVDTGYSIQDASFHSQIHFNDSQTLLRFSNFGSMVTFFEGDKIDKSLHSLVLIILSDLEYQYVPEEYISLEYDGENRSVKGFKDWSHRFFDWV